MSEFDLNWVEKYLGYSPRVMFDVGSYNGDDAERFRQKFPETAIYAFEADPERFKAIQARGFIFQSFNYAVSDVSGTIEFNRSIAANDGSGSIFEIKPEWHTNSQVVFQKAIVPTITLSDFCNEHGINNIDILHMDVQAAEYRVMKGLGKFKPKIVFGEVVEFVTYKSGTSKEEFDKLMVDLGYTEAIRLQYDSLYVLK